jgi:pimeloyl-ACP methyl ester carboxylesterase
MEPGRTLPINGMDLYFESYGDGQPLLLLHGFTGCGDDWRHVFDLDGLASRYRLIVPDARGHGRSTNPAGSFTHRQCALDLAALLDALGIDRASAIGLSLGGNTLLHLATREPARMESMVLVSATMDYPAAARALMRQVATMEHPAEEWHSLLQRHRHGPEQVRALWRHTQFFADSHDDMCFTPSDLARIAARTLIVYGDRDPLYPIEMAIQMFRAIPRAALRVVPEEGHAPIFIGHAKAGFVADALAFLGAAA